MFICSLMLNAETTPPGVTNK